MMPNDARTRRAARRAGRIVPGNAARLPKGATRPMTRPPHVTTRVFVLLLPLAATLPAGAAEPFRYPEARAGKGELKTVAGIPVLLIQGTPEETGEQLGLLALKPASGVLKLLDGFVKERGWEKVYPFLLKTGGLM